MTPGGQNRQKSQKIATKRHFWLPHIKMASEAIFDPGPQKPKNRSKKPLQKMGPKNGQKMVKNLALLIKD